MCDLFSEGKELGHNALKGGDNGIEEWAGFVRGAPRKDERELAVDAKKPKPLVRSHDRNKVAGLTFVVTFERRLHGKNGGERILSDINRDECLHGVVETNAPMGEGSLNGDRCVGRGSWKRTVNSMVVAPELMGRGKDTSALSTSDALSDGDVRDGW